MIPMPFVLAGLCVGAGAGLVLMELIPARPDLGAALERFAPPPPPTRRAPPAPGTLGLRDRIGARLAAQASGVPGLLPARADMAVLRRSAERFVFNKVAGVLAGVLFTPYLTVMLTLLGYSLPVALPLLVCPMLGAMFWYAADADVKTKASRARHEVDWALTSYLDLVALRRAGESGIVDALEEASALSPGWVFVRLREALELARIERIPPWDGLRILAEEIGVANLADIADIVSWSGQDGASVYSALRSKTHGIRTALGNLEAETAAAATVKLTMVGAVLSLLLMVLIGYPAFTRILAQ